MQWEIRQGTDVSMPFEEDDVVGLLERNKLGADALVRPFGKTAWKPALKHAPFAMAARRAAPPSPSGFDAAPEPAPATRDPARWDQQTSIELPVVQQAEVRGELPVAPSAAQPSLPRVAAAAPLILHPNWVKAAVVGVWVLVVGVGVATALTWRRHDQSDLALRTLVETQGSQLRTAQEEALTDARSHRAYRKVTLADVPNICHGTNDHATCAITNPTDEPITVCFAGRIAQKEAAGVTLVSMPGCTGRLDPNESKTVSVPWVQGRAEDICNSKSVYGNTHLDWDKCTFGAK